MTSARRPAMSDVATLAGVSGQTVSRVINGHDNVSPDTRLRVKRALAELGYRPHRAARALRTGRSEVLGVVVATLETVGNSLMLQAVAAAAEREGYSIALVSLGENVALADAVDRLAEQGVDAAVIVNEATRYIADVVSAPIRLVLVDAPADVPYPTVRSDHERAAFELTSHLLARGFPAHHIAGPADSFAAQAREQGWRRAHETADLVAPDPLRGDWTAESGRRLGAELARASEVRAVFCANDQMALGAMHALHAAGRAIPADVAVAGFDGISDAVNFWPPLTTVEQDFAGLAAAAMGLAIADTDVHRVIPAHIVQRASSVVAD
ncbi:LacI family DNA-binding transcriptional regulator [Microbacterium sp. ZW T5_56]|uniref:LacI family DNA-binding transcriptional regulator n=1 Tax=Microbacterium sp. ZW T5_56 TaxID=3378081 RepID=UPI003851C0D6